MRTGWHVRSARSSSTSREAAAPAPMRRGSTRSMPRSSLLLGLFLCVLVLLPLGWLAWYSLHRQGRARRRSANFARLVTDPTLRAPLDQTVVIAISVGLLSRLRSRRRSPGSWRAPTCRSPLRARAGDGVVRDAALPRRDRLGDPRRAEQRPPQPMVPRALRPRRHTSISSTSTRSTGLIFVDRLLRLSVRLRAGRQRARPHPGRPRGRLRDPRRRALAHGCGGSRCRWCCRRCSPARWSPSCRR